MQTFQPPAAHKFIDNYGKMKPSCAFLSEKCLHRDKGNSDSWETMSSLPLADKPNNQSVSLKMTVLQQHKRWGTQATSTCHQTLKWHKGHAKQQQTQLRQKQTCRMCADAIDARVWARSMRGSFIGHRQPQWTDG